ncbi:hypothetical protein ARALYDRAFT_320535 [Arabidopsis lyrata subsp. lyrata]|uniref:F-box domain-containing protein n=1 Tax=Arabidopsis lyrata subsp. lyrata TaxID=81972 RepID=D7LHK9_ARALL|nr:hypothetical protein ARALYDRAFT_320535 [Arabidopsis lyrata subsp. lyrata]
MGFVDEILSRLPATFLGRLRFTCKRWNALLKDSKFITKQLDKAAKQNLVLMLSNFRVYSMSINLKEIHNNIDVDPSIKFTAKLSQQVEITQVFHCNGLLLCSTKEADKTKLVVVNPCTGQTRWIEPRSDCNIYDMYTLGYENNNKKSYDSYKILRISYGCNLLEIFELKSNSWRVLPQVPPNMGLDLRLYGRGESLKGNTYWFCYFKFGMLSFDFTTETLRRVPLPFPYGHRDLCTLSLSVVKEEQLSVLRSSHDTRQMEIWMEIWMSTKIDTETFSWSKSFVFDLSSHLDLLIFTKRSEFLH